MIETGAARSVQMHANQLTVLLETVRGLVDDQFPDLQALVMRSIASEGTANAIFRVGDGFAARFPLQPGDVEATRRWLRIEAAAAGELVGRTRFPTPEPIGLGDPGLGYPLPWSLGHRLRTRHTLRPPPRVSATTNPAADPTAKEPDRAAVADRLAEPENHRAEGSRGASPGHRRGHHVQRVVEPDPAEPGQRAARYRPAGRPLSAARQDVARMWAPSLGGATEALVAVGLPSSARYRD